MKMSTYILVLFAMVCVNSVSASEPELKPGLWETRMNRTHPVTGNSVTEITRSCIKGNQFSPTQMMKGVEGCETIRNEVSGNTKIFKLACTIRDVQSTITGKMSIDSGGESGRGEMDMSINVRGMEMTMNMNWISKRVGDCPES